MAAPAPDSRHLNSLWAGVLVETLVRCGVVRAVVSPGSRSTPLAFAVAAHPGIEAVPALDERSAAFFALGQARRDLRPVALICTSGTAGANYLPAVIEAREGGVPLIVLTADRPPEMRACASGQAIDQVKLFGGYATGFHDLAPPELSEARLAYVRQATAAAVGQALHPFPGPVHLNISFRDPLPPLADDGAAARLAAAIDWDLFYSHLEPVPPRPVVGSAPALVPDVHGVIVVGPVQPADPEGFAAAMGEVARRLGWPVLADGVSPLRYRQRLVPHLITTYDLILRHPGAAERLRPEVVLAIGDWPASKVLRGWLEASGAAIWQVTERADNRDALHGRTRPLNLPLALLAASLPEAMDENGYRRMWTRYETKVRAALDTRLEAETALFEPKAAWLLARHLPAQTWLAVASSMPVRDLEYVAPPGDSGLVPRANRGANGIDGTLSTALGVAHGADRPAVLLTGDLAFLHDSNGLLLRPRLRGSLTVVVINNRGGGIFEHLPVARFEPPFEEFFATPQEVDLAVLCAAHGVAHQRIEDWFHLVRLVRELPAAGMRVLELATDRKLDAARRKQWFAELAAGLGS